MSGKHHLKVFWWNTSTTQKCQSCQKQVFLQKGSSIPLGVAGKVWEILSIQERETALQHCSQQLLLPQSWLGRATSTDKLFQTKPRFLHSDPTADSHSWASKQLCGAAGCCYSHLHLGDQWGTDRLTRFGKHRTASQSWSWQKKVGLSLPCHFTHRALPHSSGADAVKQLWVCVFVLFCFPQVGSWELIRHMQSHGQVLQFVLWQHV